MFIIINKNKKEMLGTMVELVVIIRRVLKKKGENPPHFQYVIHGRMNETDAWPRRMSSAGWHFSSV